MVYKGLPGWKALGFNSYQEYLLSDFWKRRRKDILDSLGEICSKCGSTKDIQVHHLDYFRAGMESKKDVIILCRKCHWEEHNG